MIEQIQEVERAIGNGFWYDGRRSDEFGIKVLYKARTLTPPLIPKTMQVPGHIGEYFDRVDYGPSVITVTVSAKSKTFSGLRTTFKALADWLSPELGSRPLRFDDDPDITYYAYLSNAGEIDQIIKYGKVELEFTIPEAFGLGRRQKILLAGAPAQIMRNSPASIPSTGSFVGPNEGRGSFIEREDSMFGKESGTYWNPVNTSVFLQEKIYLEGGTINLVRDAQFISKSDIDSVNCPWKLITQPGAGESVLKSDEDLLKNYAGFFSLQLICNGTENLGVEQEVDGWSPGDIVSLGGWISLWQRSSGALHFGLRGVDANGVEVLNQEVGSSTDMTDPFGNPDFSWAKLENLELPNNLDRLWVRLYVTGNPITRVTANYIQLEKGDKVTSFIGYSYPMLPTDVVYDDTEQYERLPEVIKWPGPLAMPTYEGLVSFWIFPIGTYYDGICFWSSGDTVPSGGDPFNSISMYTEDGNIIGHVGSGSGIYKAQAPIERLRPNEWNFVLLTWKENDTVDLYINKEKFTGDKASIINPQFSGESGYIMSNELGTGQIQCILDSFHVKRVKPTQEAMNLMLDNIENGLLGFGLDADTNYYLDMENLFYQTEGKYPTTLSAQVAPIIDREGNAPSSPILEVAFFGDTDRFEISQSETNRKIIIHPQRNFFDGTILFHKGETLTVDCERQVILNNYGLVYMSGLDISSDFFTLYKGSNSFSIPDDVYCTVVLYYTPKYL